MIARLSRKVSFLLQLLGFNKAPSVKVKNETESSMEFIPDIKDANVRHSEQ